MNQTLNIPVKLWRKLLSKQEASKEFGFEQGISLTAMRKDTS